MAPETRMAAVSDDRARLALLDAVRGLAGRPFSVGEAVAASGLPPHEVERQLAALVRDYESSLDVTEDGDLVYRFAPGMTAREDVVAADRRRRRRTALGRAFRSFFKAWTVVMIVAYAVIYTILAIAFLVAVASQQKGGRRTRLPSIWVFGRILDSAHMGRRQRRRVRRVDEEVRHGRDPYVLRQREADAEEKPGLLDRTWFFLFGAEGIERTPLEIEKELLTYVRAKKGLVTNADLTALLGVPYDEADRIGTRLVATYGGEMDLTDDGVAIYRFPDLTLSAHHLVEKQEPRMGYVWQLRRREHALRRSPVVVIPLLNAFNLVLCWLTYTTFLPFFGWTSALAHFSLVAFPGTFSVLFFLVGGVRWARDMASRTRRLRDDLRMSVYRLLFTSRSPVRVPGDERAIAEGGLGAWRAHEVLPHLPAIAEDLKGEVRSFGEGGLEVAVPRLWHELALVEKLREAVPSSRPVGRTVFASHAPERDEDPLAAEIAALDGGPGGGAGRAEEVAELESTSGRG